MAHFPPFRLDEQEHCLWRTSANGERIHVYLPPKAFAVLKYLVANSGRVVEHSELLNAVWGEAFVQPEVLKAQILDIRATLGDSSKNSRFIQTVPRRGYRFIAPLRAAPEGVTRTRSDEIVGRTADLSSLKDGLAQARSGERQTIFITGEKGIGKSALLDAFEREMASSNSDLRILCGSALECYGVQEPYYPLLEALGQLWRQRDAPRTMNFLAACAPTWLVQFPSLLKPEHRQSLATEILGTTRERMQREFCEAIDELAEERPLVILLDDLHWADHSSIDVISALARRRTRARVLLVCTYRPVDAALAKHPVKLVRQELILRGIAREIALQPLDRDSIAEFIGSSTEDQSSMDLVHVLYRHSEGNPLFLVAVMEHLTAKGLLRRDPTGWRLNAPVHAIDLQVPESVRQMIELQLERLDAEEAKALEAASVVGASFSAEVAALVAQSDAESFEAVCSRLVQRDFLIRRADATKFRGGDLSDSFSFLHEYYREVLYRRLSGAQRARLHRIAADAIERKQPHDAINVAAELALHCERGGMWKQAIEWRCAIASTAELRYAHREAITALIEALELARHLPDGERPLVECKTIERLVLSCLRSGDPRVTEFTSKFLTFALKYQLPEVEMQARLIALPALLMNGSRAAVDWIEKTEQLAAKLQNRVARARGQMQCAYFRLLTCGWQKGWADATCDQLDVLRQSGNPIEVATQLYFRAQVLWLSSRYRDAIEMAKEALAGFVGTGSILLLVQCQLLLYWSYLFAGEWGAALTTLESAQRTAQRNENLQDLSLIRLFGAWIRLLALDYEGAAAICRSVEAAALGSEGVPRRAYLLFRGWAERGLKHYDEAFQYLQQLQIMIESTDLPLRWYWKMPVLQQIAELYLATGRVDEACKVAEKLVDAALQTEERTWKALALDLRARTEAARSNFEAAAAFIQSALVIVEEGATPLAERDVFASAANLLPHSADQYGRAAIASGRRLFEAVEAEAPACERGRSLDSIMTHCS